MDDLDSMTLARRLLPATRRAGAEIMRYFGDQSALRLKQDGSPVSLADERAEVVILEALAGIAPDVPVVAEEAVSRGEVPVIGDRFFLVDPLDGTKEFARGSGDFTVNIALIVDKRPVFGIVYAPAMAKIYMTLGPELAVSADLYPTQTSIRFEDLATQPIHVRRPSADGLVVTRSHSHSTPELENWLRGWRLAEQRAVGSSLKFCIVASGAADLYPRFGPTCEWDIAAGHAVLCAAGGHVTTIDGSPFLYGKAVAGYLNPGFLAFGEALPGSEYRT